MTFVETKFCERLAFKNTGKVIIKRGFRGEGGGTLCLLTRIRPPADP